MVHDRDGRRRRTFRPRLAVSVWGAGVGLRWETSRMSSRQRSSKRHGVSRGSFFVHEEGESTEDGTIRAVRFGSVMS